MSEPYKSDYVLKKHVTNPRVSIVIPTYNRARDLRRCLDALKMQDFHDFEVLICDDGSTDETSEVIEKYAPFLDITYSYGENFGGPARPRNRGIQLAKAPYVAFLDSDDWWSPAKLQRSVDCLDAGADVVYHDLWNVRSADQKHFKERVASSDPVFPLFENLLCAGISIPNSSVVVRASCLHQIGGISEDKALIAVEDWDTWIRLSLVTEKFVRIPESLGYYWNGGGNISEFSPKQIRRIEAVYSRHLEKLSASKKPRALSFLAYRIGRIAQIQGDWPTARPYLCSAYRSDIDIQFRLKAIGLLIAQPVLSAFRMRLRS